MKFAKALTDRVKIIAPGSQTTLAQLGLPESFTPARLRLPSRMFPAEKKGEWEPYKIREKKTKKQAPQTNPVATSNSAQANGDVDMAGTGADGPTANGETKIDEEDEEPIYEEDIYSEDGAVYPLK